MSQAIALLILWMSITTEIACSGTLTQGAILLPVACGIMFWMRSMTGLLLAGAALLIDWVARPGFLPLCPMILPFFAACLISPTSLPDDYISRRRTILKMLTPLYLPMLTLIAVLLYLVGQQNLSELSELRQLPSRLAISLPALLMISLPISAAISMLMRLADELGIRRSEQHWI